jgi:Flp pilus assembly protein TadD
VPHQTKFTARFRTILLATTGLVVAGCNTISDESATADPSVVESKPVVSAESTTQSEEALSVEQLIRIGDKAWAKNDASTAIRLYATAAKANPKDPEPLLRIATVLRKTGRTNDAVGVYERIFTFDPYNIDAYHGLGYTNLQQEKPLQATKAFAAALTIDSNNALSLGGMAIAYDKAGDHNKAQEYYKQAIKADPENLNFKSNFALSLALTGETEKAIAILKVVTEDPRATSKHRQTLALAYGMAGQSKEAMKYSRMDLSEKDARNNALYFEALNETTDVQTATLGEQVKLMKASQDTTGTESAEVKAKPREPENPNVLMASHELETLNSNTGASKAGKAEAPKALVPTPKEPIRIAKVEKPAAPEPKAVAKSAPPKLAAPKMVAKAEMPKPATSTVVPKPSTAKPTTVTKETPKSENTSQMAKVEPKEQAPKYSEWTLKDKSTTAPAPSIEKSVADSDNGLKEDISFKPGSGFGEAKAYKPDGGKYYLQLGSYKERSQAENGWKILQSQNKDVLGGVDPIFAEADLGSENGGVFYRVQIGGFSDKTQTMRLCGTLRDRSFDCFMPMGANIAKPKGDMTDQIMVDKKTKEDVNQTVAQDNKVQSDDGPIADFVKESGAL